MHKNDNQKTQSISMDIYHQAVITSYFGICALGVPSSSVGLGGRVAPNVFKSRSILAGRGRASHAGRTYSYRPCRGLEHGDENVCLLQHLNFKDLAMWLQFSIIKCFSTEDGLKSC